MTRHLTAPLCALLLALMAAACGGRTEILDTVPADSPAIITVNAERLSRAMDGKEYGGTLNTDQTLDRFLAGASERGTREIKTILTSAAIDRSLMAGFIMQGGGKGVPSILSRKGMVYTFYIRKLADLLSELGAAPTPARVGAFDVYALEDVGLFVKEGQGWLVAGDPSRQAPLLKGALDRAAARSVASVKPLASWLGQHGEIVRGAFTRSADADGGWTCMALDVDDSARAITAEASLLGPDGKQDSFGKYLGTVDASLLDYTMPSDVVVAAAAIRPGTDWEALTDYVSSLSPLDYRQRGVVAVALPYLRRLDGTVLVAAGPTLAEIPGDRKWTDMLNFVIALQLRKGDASGTVEELAGVLGMLGVNPTKSAGGYTIVLPGTAPVVLKAVDKRTVVIANRPLEQLGNDAARKLLKGKAAGLWADIPAPLAEATYGGRGFSMALAVDDDAASTFSLNGSTLPILEQLATMK